MFQTLAYHLVQSQQIIGRNTFPIRRVGDNHGLFRRLEGLQLQDNVFRYTCCLDVVRCYFVGLRIIVVSVYLMCKLTFLTVVVVNRIE